MFSKRSNSRVFLSLIVIVFTLVLLGTDAWSAKLTTLSTSALAVTSSFDQVGECIVANLGNKDVIVTIDVVSQSAGRLSLGKFTITPDEIFDLRLSFSPGFFLCSISYFDNKSEIRASARVADITENSLTVQRSEAR